MASSHIVLAMIAPWKLDIGLLVYPEQIPDGGHVLVPGFLCRVRVAFIIHTEERYRFLLHGAASVSCYSRLIHGQDTLEIVL